MFASGVLRKGEGAWLQFFFFCFHKVSLYFNLLSVYQVLCTDSIIYFSILNLIILFL